MSKRTILVLLVVFACVVALIAILRQRRYDHFNAGEVTVIDSRGSAVPTQTAPETPRAARKEPAGKPVEDANATVETSSSARQSDVTDTLPPSASERVSTSGSGRFQVYRQGNLTWRVDTENGSTCVLFATDNEWRNPRVSRRACERE